MMPAYITHALFGDDLLRQLPSAEQTIINQNFHSYSLGLQGPDILFFRNAITGQSPLNQYGKRMHQQKTEALFTALAHYCTLRQGKSDEKAILAYALGFIGHYALDSTCHPYIYWLQEDLKKRMPGNLGSSIHHSIEGMIDSAVYRQRYYQSPHHFPYQKYFVNNHQITAPVALLYTYLLQEVYGIQVATGEIALSIRDTYTYAKWELDPTGGLLIGGVHLYEQITGRIGKYSCFLKKTPVFDVLNLNRRKWTSLAEPGEPRGITFPELLWTAQKSATTITNDFINALQTGQPYTPTGLKTFDAGAPQ